MKTKDLLELLKGGAQPIVESTLENDDDKPDYKMIGRIKSACFDDYDKMSPYEAMTQCQYYDEFGNLVIFNVDFFEFTDYNKQFAEPKFDGLTWMEIEGYEYYSKDHPIREHIEYSNKALELFGLKDSDDPIPDTFNIVFLESHHSNKYICEYLESKSNLTYTDWLRKKLENKLNLETRYQSN